MFRCELPAGLLVCVALVQTVYPMSSQRLEELGKQFHSDLITNNTTTVHQQKAISSVYSNKQNNRCMRKRNCVAL